MRAFVYACVLGLGLGSGVAQPVFADANPQLVNSVQIRLAQYGYSVDVSQFALSTVARLHFTLSSTTPYVQKRRALRAILRNPKYK